MTLNSRVRSLGWVTGLIITTSLVGGIVGVYQRGPLLVPAASITPAPKALWAAGTWEADAAAYLDRHAYDVVSSVNPPAHRSHPHAQRRSAAP